MEPFIRSDQYHFIKQQLKQLINGHATVNDSKVLNALKSLVHDKVQELFTRLNEDQSRVLSPITDIQDSTNAEAYLILIKPYVIPFRTIKEQDIKKLFPKAKKLKVPPLKGIDYQELTYLGWIDSGSNKKYIVIEFHDKLIGINGTFSNNSQKGICALCNRHEQVSMFLSLVKGKMSGEGAYIKRGNYICQDSEKCNQNLITLDKLHEFIELLSK
jgi:hypothetical protein